MGSRGGFNRRVEVASTMIAAMGLYALEIVPSASQNLRRLETCLVRGLWGTSRPGRSKEVLFALLTPGHRISPLMGCTYMRICWLARIARSGGVLTVAVQALWEHRHDNSKVQGPFARAMDAAKGLG